MGLEGVKVAGDGTDVFVDRPFVVVEDDDETFGGFRDVVEGFQRGSAGEGGVTRDGDDMVVTSVEIACGGDAESGREAGSRMARSEGIVFGFAP